MEYSKVSTNKNYINYESNNTDEITNRSVHYLSSSKAHQLIQMQKMGQCVLSYNFETEQGPSFLTHNMLIGIENSSQQNKKFGLNFCAFTKDKNIQKSFKSNRKLKCKQEKENVNNKIINEANQRTKNLFSNSKISKKHQSIQKSIQNTNQRYKINLQTINFHLKQKKEEGIKTLEQPRKLVSLNKPKITGKRKNIDKLMNFQLKYRKSSKSEKQINKHEVQMKNELQQQEILNECLMKDKIRTELKQNNKKKQNIDIDNQQNNNKQYCPIKILFEQTNASKQNKLPKSIINQKQIHNNIEKLKKQTNTLKTSLNDLTRKSFDYKSIKTEQKIKKSTRINIKIIPQDNKINRIIQSSLQKKPKENKKDMIYQETKQYVKLQKKQLGINHSLRMINIKNNKLLDGIISNKNEKIEYKKEKDQSLDKNIVTQYKIEKNVQIQSEPMSRILNNINDQSNKQKRKKQKRQLIQQKQSVNKSGQINKLSKQNQQYLNQNEEYIHQSKQQETIIIQKEQKNRQKHNQDMQNQQITEQMQINNQNKQIENNSDQKNIHNKQNINQSKYQDNNSINYKKNNQFNIKSIQQGKIQQIYLQKKQKDSSEVQSVRNSIQSSLKEFIKDYELNIISHKNPTNNQKKQLKSNLIERKVKNKNNQTHAKKQDELKKQKQNSIKPRKIGKYGKVKQNMSNVSAVKKNKEILKQIQNKNQIQEESIKQILQEKFKFPQKSKQINKRQKNQNTIRNNDRNYLNNEMQNTNNKAILHKRNQKKKEKQSNKTNNISNLKYKKNNKNFQTAGRHQNPKNCQTAQNFYNRNEKKNVREEESVHNLSLDAKYNCIDGTDQKQINFNDKLKNQALSQIQHQKSNFNQTTTSFKENINRNRNQYQRAPLLSFIINIPKQLDHKNNFKPSKTPYKIQFWPEIKKQSYLNINSPVKYTIQLLLSIDSWILQRIIEPFFNLQGNIGIWLNCNGVWQIFSSSPPNNKSHLEILEQLIIQVCKLKSIVISIESIANLINGSKIVTLRNSHKIFTELKQNIRKYYHLKALVKQQNSSNLKMYEVSKVQTTVEGQNIIKIESNTDECKWIREQKFNEVFDRFILIYHHPSTYWSYKIVKSLSQNKAIYTLQSPCTVHGFIQLHYNSNTTSKLYFYKQIEPKVLKFLKQVTDKKGNSSLYSQFSIKGSYYTFIDCPTDCIVSVVSSSQFITLDYQEHIENYSLKNKKSEYVKINKLVKMNKSNQLQILKNQFMKFILKNQ